jgi:outer membrane biosynthesis protein TonB
LKERQVLANVTLDFTTNYFLIFQTQKVTVTADIVEFNEIGSNKAEVRKTKMPEPQTDKIKDATQPIPNATAPKAAKTETENVPTPKVTKTETEKTPTPKATTIEKEKAPEQQAPKIEKENSPVPVSNTTPTPVPGFEPTILYSQEADIVTSSGERYKVETGDYFIGTLDEKGNPENGKLYGKNGRPKHVILPRRNH